MFRKICGFCVYVVYLLAVSEGLLWLAASVSDPIKLLLSNQYGAPRYLDDPRVGHIPNPDFAEHDEWGYRNALIGPLGFRSREVPSEVNVVVLGDSQTYGINAPPEFSWPVQLSGKICQSVYNMAVSASGPPRYLYNLNQAISLNPSLIIVGFYFGNDFWDSAAFAYHRNFAPQEFEAWRQALRERNPEYVEVMEQVYPIAVQKSLESAKILEPGFSVSSATESDKQTPVEPEGRVRDFLREHSKLYAVLRLIKMMATNPEIREGRQEAKTRLNPKFQNEICKYAKNNNGVFCFNYSGASTVLDARLRIRDERVLRAGFEVAVEALAMIRDRLKENSIDYLVVLIPSKEYIFLNAFPKDLRLLDGLFAKLNEQEGRIRRALMRELEGLGIRYLDTLPSLISAARQGRAIYPASSQGHPSSHGYEVIAQSTARYLQETGWGASKCLTQEVRPASWPDAVAPP